MRVYKYYLDSGSMHGISAADTRSRVEGMMRQWESFCDVKYEPVASSSRAYFKLYFRNNDQMRRAYNNRQIPLGLAGGRLGRGVIYLNNERKLPLNRKIQWYVENLVAHEMGHILGLNHSNDPKSVMHINNTTHFWSKRGVAYWQAIFGRPKRQWFPGDRTLYGGELQRLRRESAASREKWISLKAERDKHTDRPTRLKIQKLVVAEVNKIRSYDREAASLAKRWHAANKYWRGSYMCHIG